MTTMTIDAHATALTRTRYQRLSPFYDLMEGMAEFRYDPWRKKLWSLVSGSKVLEVGVGTGKNMPHYPKGIQITAIDLTPGMLDVARRHAEKLRPNVDLRLGDAQSLDFPNSSFDTAVATFFFCSVPDPLLGLRELARVVKPDGKILLLEHIRSENEVIGKVMDALINRGEDDGGEHQSSHGRERKKAGLQIESVEDLVWAASLN